LESLIGANRAYVESALPELPQLLAGSLDELRASCEVLVIAGTNPEFARVIRKLKKSQKVIDLVGLLDPEQASRAHIEGLCW